MDGGLGEPKRRPQGCGEERATDNSTTSRAESLRLARRSLTEMERSRAMEFAGIWGGGDDAYALWTGAEWDDFQSKWNDLSGQGQRLVDLETYVDGGGVRRYAGVWRAGTDPHYLWAG